MTYVQFTYIVFHYICHALNILGANKQRWSSIGYHRLPWSFAWNMWTIRIIYNVENQTHIMARDMMPGTREKILMK
jgi:hypothetical protein